MKRPLKGEVTRVASSFALVSSIVWASLVLLVGCGSKASPVQDAASQNGGAPATTGASPSLASNTVNDPAPGGANGATDPSATDPNSVPGAANSGATNIGATQTGYAVGEDSATANSGPVRIARISFLKGPVTWRASSTNPWTNASMNLPLRQGAEVWVKGGSRGEMQFDDGSTLRMGGGTVASLPSMYSDSNGEFTEVKLNNGLCTFRLRNKLSQYQIDTPLSSIKATGPSEIRVGVGSNVEVAVHSGRATVSGQQGESVLASRQRLDIPNQTDPYVVTTVPPSDTWDQFNDNRDVIYDHPSEHVPSNIGLVAGDLDSYGTWHNDPNRGYVWAPRVQERGWRPYHNGRWVWVSPWGWTWVGSEDWGYAPYHYGTWVDESYGWAWVPGPSVQYWSPGVVAYVGSGTSIGWAPLGPDEVRYPSGINIGFQSGNWALNFSIGGVAAYYPSGNSYCEGRPWGNVYANSQVNYYNSNNITNVYNQAGPGAQYAYGRNSGFIPQNGSRYAGMTLASRSGFLVGNGYQAPAADPRGTIFRNGQSFNRAPTNAQVFGPPGIRPGRGSFSASRSVAQNGAPPQNLLGRSVVRAAVPSAIATRSMPVRGSMLFPRGQRQINVPSTRGPGFAGVARNGNGGVGRGTNTPGSFSPGSAHSAQRQVGPRQAAQRPFGQGQLGQRQVGQRQLGQVRAVQVQPGQVRATQQQLHARNAQAHQNRANQNRANQNRANQNGAIQNKAGQNRGVQNRGGQNRVGQVQGGQLQRGQARGAQNGGGRGQQRTPGRQPQSARPQPTRPNRGGSSQGGRAQGRPAQGRPSQGRPAQGRPSQGRPSQGRPSQGRPSQRPSSPRPSKPQNGPKPGKPKKPSN